jgi:hypothetical protein
MTVHFSHCNSKHGVIDSCRSEKGDEGSALVRRIASVTESSTNSQEQLSLCIESAWLDILLINGDILLPFLDEGLIA